MSEPPRMPSKHDIRVINMIPSTYGDAGRTGPQQVDLTFMALHGPLEFGDIQMMTTDGHGGFHPFWNDYRSGRARLRTSTITVRGNAIPNGDSALAGMEDVTSRVTLQYRDLGIDEARGEYIARVRLQNHTKEPLRGPFFLRLTTLAPAIEMHESPTVVNASNKRTGVGATWDARAAVKGGTLAPGEQSEPIELRFHLPTIDPAELPPKATVLRKPILRIAIQVLSAR
jgi:hypothetical protein